MMTRGVRNNKSLSSSCSAWRQQHRRRRSLPLAAAALSCWGGSFVRGMVSLHGHSTQLSPRFRLRESAGVHNVANGAPPPPDPLTLLSTQQQAEQIGRLVDWFTTTTTTTDGSRQRNQILCLTGAGLSTESGVPDYRGAQGSYHKGHKPQTHDQFMKSEYQRKRYWGRGLVGWKPFDAVSPNEGHVALATLEAMGRLGVDLVDQPAFYPDGKDDLDWNFTSGNRRLALVTQNVDTLHRRAGSKHLIELHGRTDRLRCMQCGQFRDRKSFHAELTQLNDEWLQAALQSTSQEDMRADGDANLQTENYDVIRLPPCTKCGGFLKPDVVFFGDTVPKHRVAQVSQAVHQADGLLVVGSSLAVHSAFRHVRAACQQGIPVAILNVGETRAEVEGLNVLKIEAPAGPTLAGVVEELKSMRLYPAANEDDAAASSVL